MGCCWSCTRPYAALVLFAIALSGGVLCSTGSWPLVVVWAVASLAGFLFYFVFLPDADHVPPWCQSVGPIKASMDPQVWERLATAQIQQDWDSLDALDAKAYQYEFDYAYSHTANQVMWRDDGAPVGWLAFLDDMEDITWRELQRRHMDAELRPSFGVGRA